MDPRRLGVLGWPVRHSRSPAMHTAALRELGLHEQGWRYQHLPVAPELLEEIVRALPGSGFRGVNVTIPHKEAALELATSATDRARAIGAANTLTFDGEGGIHADNTDAPGFLEALRGSGGTAREPPGAARPRDVRGRRTLVLGAGGSARAVVFALCRAGADVLVHNRTRERAERLVAEVGGRVADGLEEAAIVVNCTSVGLPGEARIRSGLKELPFPADGVRAGMLVVDLVYRAGGTPLLRAARARGADVVDGLDILVAQGAISLEGWTGMTAPRAVMRAAAGD